MPLQKESGPGLLLGWRRRRGGRSGRLGERAEEGDLGAGVFRGEGDGANLIAAFADEGDVLIGNLGVAEGWGKLLRAAVLAREFRAQVLEIPVGDEFAGRVRVVSAGHDLGPIVIERDVRVRRAAKHQRRGRINGQAGADFPGLFNAEFAERSAYGGFVTAGAESERIDHARGHQQGAAKKNREAARHGDHHEEKRFGRRSSIGS